MDVRTDQVIVYVVRPTADEGDHEVLQLRRAPGKYLGGQWSFAGGKIEAGETVIEAAVRELREETGLRPRSLAQLSYVETFYVPQFDAIWHRPGFLAIIGRDAAVRLNEEHTDWRFIRRREIARKVLWPGERRALAEVFREHLRPELFPANALRQIELPTIEPSSDE